MNSKIKLLVTTFVIGLAGIPLLRAADDGTIAVAPIDSTAKEETPAGKGHDGKRMQAMAEHRLQQLDDALKLTPDQKQKIKDIWAKQAADFKNIAPEERRTKGREAFKAAHDEVRALLTPEQQTKFDTMKPEGYAGRGKGKKAE